MHSRAGDRKSFSLAALALFMAASLGALPVAAAAPGPVVWYRASDECPAGSEFLKKLSGRAMGARLAQAGDHPDFVVTLLAAPGETLGRLERQTQSGTVAIRELRDASCLRVADALALGLTLALEPVEDATELPGAVSPPLLAGAKRPDPSASAESSQEPATVSHPQGPPPRVVDPLVGPPRQKDTARAPESHPAETSAWWLGGQGGALTGVAPDPLARVAFFLDAERALRLLAPRFSFRFAVVGVLGSTSTEVGSVRHWIAAGRLEGCPWRWGGVSSIRPCLAFELGASGARGSRSSGSDDTGLWATPGAAVRGGLALAKGLRLEAELGAFFPLVRNDIYAGSEALYRAEITSFQGSLGVSGGLP
jgi:hypothetical protein